VAAAARVVGSDAGVDGIAGTQRPARNQRSMVVRVLGVGVRASHEHVEDGSFESLLEPHSRCQRFEMLLANGSS